MVATGNDYIEHRDGPGFSAPVIYVQPTYEELMRRFPAFVSPDYFGRKFEPVGRCRDVLQEARNLPEGRNLRFVYVFMRQSVLTNGVFAEMDREGLRPAIYEEILGFDRAYPDEQMKHPIVAIGSIVHVRCSLAVACLWHHEGGRGLRQGPFNYSWPEDCRFLAVRREIALPP